MLKRRTGKSASEDASSYSRRAAAVDSLWLAQDRVRTGVRGGIERAGFGVQDRLLWPLQDRLATMGAPGRTLSGAAAIVLAAAAVAAGLLVAGSGDPSAPARPQVAVSAVAPAPPEPPAPQRAEPTLKGASPVFEPAESAPPTEVDPAKAIVKSSPAASDPAAERAGASAAPSSSAQASDVDGPTAGQEAIAVARDFANAFVIYETGDTGSEVRGAFAETATPALSRALLERPPRLPADVEVPEAKVLNVVSAPSHGDVYPLSVSLLRVGVTSELRIEMEQRKGEGWRVTNVLG